MFGRLGKSILWILALVAIWVLMDVFVIILGNDNLLYTRFPWAPPSWSSSVGRLTPFPEWLPGRGSTS